MAYTTAALLKTYLGISAATDDTLLGNLITYAQQMVDIHCRRTFESSANANKTFDAVADVDGPTLYLKSVGDLCAINSITNGDSVAVAANEYVTELRNSTPYYAIRILASADKVWTYTTDPENAITISGKWAYSTSAPNDIVYATTRLAAYLYRQKDNAGDLDRALLAEGTVLLPTDLPTDVTRILAPYVRLL